MAKLCIFPHDSSAWRVLHRAGNPATEGLGKAAPWRQVFPAMMSASNLHTQPPSPPGPGWEPALTSYTRRWQREEKLRAANRRRPAPLGTGAPAGPRTPRGAPRNRCDSDSRRGMQPARVIHRFKRCCGPARRGGEGGGGVRQPRGRIQPQASRGEDIEQTRSPPPLPGLWLPAPSPAQPGTSRPASPRPPIPFPAGAPCNRSGRRWGR